MYFTIRYNFISNNMGESLLPFEIVQNIFSFNPKEMYLLNKRFTEIYLKFKYGKQRIDISNDAESISNFGSLYPYNSYVRFLRISTYNTPVQLQQFQNVDDLIICDHGGLDSTKRTIRQLIVHFPRLKNLNTFESDPVVLIRNITPFQNLVFVRFYNMVPEMICFNEMPNLASLVILSGGRLQQRWSYKFMPSLKYIKSLVILSDHTQSDLNHINQVFPNLRKLEFTQISVVGVPSFKHLTNLKELLLTHDCEIPPKLKYLTCRQQNTIKIPTINESDCLISVVFELDYIQNTFEQSFFKVVEYCSNIGCLAMIQISTEIMGINRYKPPFGPYAFCKVGALYFFYKPNCPPKQKFLIDYLEIA